MKLRTKHMHLKCFTMLFSDLNCHVILNGKLSEMVFHSGAEMAFHF